MHVRISNLAESKYRTWKIKTPTLEWNEANAAHPSRWCQIKKTRENYPGLYLNFEKLFMHINFSPGMREITIFLVLLSYLD